VRFVHISDSHIGSRPDFKNYGHVPLTNLESTVEAINSLPFQIDFVLHTGDVVEDRSEAAYRIAAPVLAKLKMPVLYVAGNHDDPHLMQQVLMGQALDGERLDYVRDIAGVRLAVFDTRGPNPPGGTLTPDQFARLRDVCTPDGPPLLLAMHHPPLRLDSSWLDNGWKTYPSMLLDCGERLMETLAPARDRIRGLFLGHLHRSYQVMRNGIFMSSALSSFGQLETWPSSGGPVAAPYEPGGFCLVTITPEQTTVSQHVLARPVERA
jgi:Icc protein